MAEISAIGLLRKPQFRVRNCQHGDFGNRPGATALTTAYLEVRRANAGDFVVRPYIGKLELFESRITSEVKQLGGS